MPIHHDGVKSERRRSLPVRLHIVLQRSLLALPQPVDVEDGHQVVQLVVSGERHGLPDGALGALAVSDQAVGAVGGLVEVFTDVGHAAGHAEALAQTAGGHVDEVEAGGRVALQVVVDLTELQELLGGDKASLGPRCGWQGSHRVTACYGTIAGNKGSCQVTRIT